MSSASHAGASPDDVLSVLKEFELGLESLKKLHAQRQALSEEMRERSEKMAADEAALRVRREQIDKRERAFQESDKALEERRREISSRETSIESQSAELKRWQAEIAVKSAEIEAESASLQQRASELAAARERQARDMERLAEGETRMASREAKAAERESVLSVRDTELSRRDAETAARAKAIAEQAGRLEEDRVRVSSEAAALSGARKALEDERRALESERAAVAAGRVEIEAQRRSIEQEAERVAQARQRLEDDRRSDQTDRGEADRLRAAIADLERKIAASREESERALADERATSSSSLARVTSELNARLEAERSAARDAAAKVAALEREIAAARSSANGEKGKAGAEIERATRQAAELGARLSAADARIAELELQIAEHEAAQSTARSEFEERSRERIEELARSLASAQSVVLEYESLWLLELSERVRERARHEAEIAEAVRSALRQAEVESRRAGASGADAKAPSPSKDAGGAPPADPKAEERLRKAAELIAALREEREELARRVASMGEEIAQARSAIDSARARGDGVSARERVAYPPELRRRKARLQKGTALLHARSKKIRKAEGALATRFDQCERVLSMRQEIIEAREVLRSAQMKAAKAVAGGRAAALIFYGVASIGVMGVASWYGTQAAIEGTYAAKAVIGATSRSGELGAGAVAEWTRYHEQLVTDPRFISEAAERFERRGIMDHANAGALTKTIETNLTLDSSKPGEITMEWRGLGAERTARVLETFASTLVSQSNAARERRVDGLVTETRQAATPGRERLDSEYRIYAAGVWGGSVLLSFIIAGTTWRRLVRAKAQFEGSAIVDTAVDPARWDLPVRKK